MRFELYQTETEHIAKEHASLLDDVQQTLSSGGVLSRLEQKGVLHSIQILTENAIGKAKQILKAREEPVPVSAYDAFSALARIKVVADEDLPAWNAAIGLRNRIVHEYMNIDMTRVYELVRAGRYQFIVDFLLRPIDLTG